MQNIFLEAVNMSIGASIAVFAVLILRLLLKKTPRRFLCLLWLTVAFKLIFPLSIEVPFGFMPKNDTVTADNFVLTFLDESDSLDVSDDESVVASDKPYVEKTVQRIDLNSVLTYCWISGVAVFVIYFIVEYIRLKRVLRGSLDFEPGVKVSNNIKTPFVMGLFAPVIYIPSNMEEPDITHVIAHEKAHIRHLDHLLKPFAYLLLSVYWFDPFVWLAYIFFCRDMELACDEAVIKKLDKEERRAYSISLLNCSTGGYLPAVSPIAFGEVCVKKRVKRIMSYRKTSRFAVVFAAFFMAFSFVCLMTGASGSEKTVNGVYNYQLMPYRNNTYGIDFITENFPSFKVSEGNILSYRSNDYAQWTELGALESVRLTERNFDTLFPSSGVGFSKIAKIREDCSSAWVWKNTTADYIDRVYLIYNEDHLQAHFAIVRTPIGESEPLISWMSLSHSSWNNGGVLGSSYKEALEKVITERNKDLFSGDIACVSLNYEGRMANGDDEIDGSCTYLYKVYDIEDMSSESVFENANIKFKITENGDGTYRYDLIHYEVVGKTFVNYVTKGALVEACDRQFDEYLEYLNEN